jgi:nicotinate phosphoribosyltransferase
MSRHSALLTDLYELTMAAAYFDSGMLPNATFELFVRRLPEQRSYLVAAGLEQALDYLEALRFTGADIDYLRAQPVFGGVSAEFFDYLREFRFHGEVWATPEGTPGFAQEPLVRVTAPIIEAQVVETYLLAAIGFQTMVASKAARVVQAAAGRDVFEFGTRRAHGPEAGVLAARASFIGGCAGTSNVEAGRHFGIPVFGTLAHSFIMAFDDECESFRRMERIFPGYSVLLVDTYDTLQAVDALIAEGLRPRGVRLDSGDLAELSRAVRRKLDAAGLRDTIIFASGDLNEYAIAELLAAGAPVDSFGVGTEMVTSKDAPALSSVYKLVEVTRGHEHAYRLKLSQDKVSYPGAKQVFRISRGGRFERDVVASARETCAGADPVLVCVMREGRRLAASPGLPEIQRYARDQIARLPERCRRPGDACRYPVEFSGELWRLQQEERTRHQRA